MRQAGRIPPDQSEIAFPDAIAQSTVFTRLQDVIWLMAAEASIQLPQFHRTEERASLILALSRLAM